MDPNNPGQKPGDPTPPPATPPWGTPPPDSTYGTLPAQPPATPPWGTPPPESTYGTPPTPPPATPPWGSPPPDSTYGTAPTQPPATPPWGTPPPESTYGIPPAQPYGNPPESPYGAPPAWGAPAPAAPRRRGLPRRLLAAIGGFIVVVVILAIVGLVLNPSHAGQVIFTTDPPTDSGASTCQLGHQVTSVSVGTKVYANYFFKSRLDNQTVTLTVLKNGSSLGTTPLSSDQSNGVDCLEDNTDLSTLGAGTYEFKLTTADGTVVSDGTLTIK